MIVFVQFGLSPERVGESHCEQTPVEKKQPSPGANNLTENIEIISKLVLYKRICKYLGRYFANLVAFFYFNNLS